MGKKLHNHHCFRDMINYWEGGSRRQNEWHPKARLSQQGLFRTIRTQDLQTRIPWQHLPLLLRAGVDYFITISVTSFEMSLVDLVKPSLHCADGFPGTSRGFWRHSIAPSLTRTIVTLIYSLNQFKDISTPVLMKPFNLLFTKDWQCIVYGTLLKFSRKYRAVYSSIILNLTGES